MAKPKSRPTFFTLNFSGLRLFEYTICLSFPLGQLRRGSYSKPSAWPSLSTNAGLGGSLGQAAIEPKQMKALP
jgi:hypothetical protein